MSFLNSKGTDDVIKGSVTRTDYLIGNPPDYEPYHPSISIVETSSRCIGTKTETYFNKTKKYRPGFGVVNPIIHYKNVGSCTSGSLCDVYITLAGKLKRIRSLEGHIAALTQQYFSPNFVSNVPPGPAELQALQKAIGKASVAKAMVGVTFGEAPETISMFVDPFKKLAHEGYKFQKLIPRNVRSIASFAMNAWLQVRYGVFPLMGEIDTYRNLIAEGHNRVISDMLKEKAGWASPSSHTTARFVRNSTCGAYLHGTESMERGTRVAATAYFRRTRSVMSENLGIDFSSLPSTLWELVPYSFVVDWFIDVGSWLDNLNPNNSVSHIQNCLSLSSYERATTCVTGVSAQAEPSASNPVSACSSVYVSERSSYQRDVGLTLPALPLVNYRDLSLARQIDSVSLALQRAQNLFTIKRR